MTKTTNVLIAGVGGQGVILASYAMGEVAMSEGHDVKSNDVVGMSQRGGSVVSHLRFGEKVQSPLVAMGQADVMLCFEQMEALRYYHWLKPGGLLIYNLLRVNPATVAGGFATYPDDVPGRIAAAWDNVLPVDGTGLATEAGNIKAANMALLGAISGSVPFSIESWKAVIQKVVPQKTIEANLKAFDLGRAVGVEAGVAVAS
jgi:indolepyruvate ferredoxin oxidoreductase, beta subunit